MFGSRILTPKTATSLGVDIGSRVTKAILAEQVTDRINIQGAGSFDIPGGVVADGVILNPKSFGRTLGTQLAAQGIGRAPTVISIPSNLATLRWISLPALEGQDLREAAQFKVKRHLPFPVSDAYVDATPPKVVGEDGTGTSLVIAVRRSVVDSRAEALEYAGLEPMSAELEAQAILRVVERRLNEQSVLWRDASLTIIDVGGTNTHMYVVQSQQLQFIRGVKFGADMIANSVASALDVTKEEAEAMMGHHETELRSDGTLRMGLAEEPVIVNIQLEMEKLTREFLRLLRYFRSLHPERSYAGILDHLIVCGGLVGLRGFAEYLQQDLGLRVERARPFKGMVAKFNRESFQSISNRQEAFTVVMGLALSGLRDGTNAHGENHAGREFAWKRTA
jgi:type IV pilus assembly protein PilM